MTKATPRDARWASIEAEHAAWLAKCSDDLARAFYATFEALYPAGQPWEESPVVYRAALRETFSKLVLDGVILPGCDKSHLVGTGEPQYRGISDDEEGGQ